MRSKKGQIAIFVIISLVIVVSIALVFTLLKLGVGKAGIREDPQAYIRICAKEAIVEIEEQIFATNGYPNTNNTNSMIYKGEKVPYLCKVSEFYTPCTPQEPLFVGKLGKNIKEYLDPRVQNCFQEIIKEFEREGYDVSLNGTGKVEVIFESNAIVVSTNKKITVIKGDESRSYDNFRTEVNSPLYNLVDTAEKIVNFESTLCEFNHLNWMLNYPDIKIEKFSASDQTKVYTIIDRESEKNLDIAIKTCILPAGI